MKLRMLSLLSIILALSIKSLDISAKDYHDFRVFANAIPDVPYAPLVPLEIQTELDSIVYQLAQSNAIMERCVGISDSISPEFEAYERMKIIATEEQLNNLLLHDSPVVKVYAHRALILNDMNMNCDYELALLEDTTCVDWFNEDVLMNSTVQDMIQVAYLE